MKFLDIYMVYICKKTHNKRPLIGLQSHNSPLLIFNLRFYIGMFAIKLCSVLNYLFTY